MSAIPLLKKPKLTSLYEFNSFWEEIELCDKILKILTEYYEDDRLIQEEIKNKCISDKFIFESILEKESTRSDVRGFIAKLLIENCQKIELLDDLIQKLILYNNPLINFGILYGLEERSDFVRIKNYFANSKQERLNERANEILKNYKKENVSPQNQFLNSTILFKTMLQNINIINIPGVKKNVLINKPVVVYSNLLTN